MEKHHAEAKLTIDDTLTATSSPAKLWWGNLVRFIHVTEARKGVPRMTVAYVRNGTYNTIDYAYTLLSPKERYVKSVGREIAASRLFGIGRNCKNESAFTGTVTGRDITDYLCAYGLDDVFADDVMKTFSVLDFKHSFLSRIIVERIVAH